MNIVVTGKMGAGKDELVRMLVEDHGFARIALADRLKQIARLLYPFEFREGGDPLVRRKRLQKLGDDLREKEPRVFSRALAEDLEAAGRRDRLVLTDARYHDEWDVFRVRFAPCRLVRIVTSDDLRFARLLARDGKLPDSEALAHPSENGLAVADVPGVIEIDNAGSLEGLRASASRLVHRIGPPD